MASFDFGTCRNLLLRSLPADDQARLAPHMARIELPTRTVLERPGVPVDMVVFPESGLASTLVRSTRDRQIEIAVIGREGMTGSCLGLGSDRPTTETFMQMPGDGIRIGAQAFRDALSDSPGLRSSILVYVHCLISQISQTALSNGRSRLEERLARWLLMSHDRSDDDQLRLTHEFLALMLGVRRVGVTVAINRLVADGCIATSRGRIRVCDREALEARTGGAYGISEAEYVRMMGLDRAFHAALAV